MEKIRVLNGKQDDIQIDMNLVMDLLSCKADSPVLEDFKREYQKLLPKVIERIRPAAAFVVGSIRPEMKSGILLPESKVIYVISTVGQGISDYSSFYFKRGNYVKGMLLDAMADVALFSYENKILAKVKEISQEMHMGVSHRYEAPLEIPMEMQKVAYEALNASKTLGLSITSGYMFSPVKSTCQIFELTEKEDIFVLEHDCNQCERKDCSMRKKKDIQVTLHEKNGSKVLQTLAGSNVMEVLQENGIYINAACGGNGRCGKCRIKVLEGNIEITQGDKKSLTEKAIKKGIRLACCATLWEDCQIEICEQEQAFQALSITEEHMEQKGEKESFEKNAGAECEQKYAVAIDIGTTTIAIALICLESSKIVSTYTSMNHQKIFGADVIARIQASNMGKQLLLQKSIQDDLLTGIHQLFVEQKIALSSFVKIGIAGNTTMLYLLRGYPCESLGIYPFAAEKLEMEKRSYREFFSQRKGNEKSIDKEIEQTDVFVLPGNSAFVGADIVAGLYACDFQKKDEICILVDLGTNGEMAIGNRKKLLVTSTAAGPAFEGGNISWGMGSIPGAISKVKIEKGNVQIETIDKQKPIGICGTGIVETVAELLKNGLMDETGALDEKYVKQGFPLAKAGNGESIVITQKDIREIQLAKSAIRAGIETIIAHYKVSYDQIAKVYLAGGFGHFLDVSQAVAIGMLPSQLADRTEAVGNTSLEGTIKFLTSKNDASSILKELAEKGEEISLAMDKDFQESYMENMLFDKIT